MFQLIDNSFFRGLMPFFNSSEEPDIIPQEEILAKMDPREMARLARVRNIGIAVCFSFCLRGGGN